MANILIAGCGAIGTALAQELIMRGHQVWGLRRAANLLPCFIKPIQADLTVAASLRLPADIDYVFYIVAANEFSDSSYYQSYVLGVSNLLQVLTQTNTLLPHFFFISSTSVYHQSNGEDVDETSPTVPTHFAGKRLLEAEQLLLANAIPATIVRFAGIYGVKPDRLMQEVRQSTVTLAANQVYTNRIHQKDCVNVLSHLLDLSNRDKLYLAVDHEPALKSEVMAWLAEQMGVVLPIMPDDGVATVMHPLRNNKRCHNTRLVNSGYQFLYPTFREGYRQLLTTSGI